MLKRLFLVLMIALLAVPLLAQDDEADEEAEAAALMADVLSRVEDGIDQLESFDSVTLEGELSVSQRVESAESDTTINTSITQEIQACIEYGEDRTPVAVNATLLQSLDMDMGLGSGELTIDIIILDGEVYIRARDTSGLMQGQFTEDEWIQLGQSEEGDLLAEAFGDPQQLIASFSEQLQYPINTDTVVEVDDRRGRDIDDDPTERWELVLDAEAVYATGALDDVLSGVDLEAVDMDPDTLISGLLDDAEISLDAFLSEETGILRRIDSTIVLGTALEIQGQVIALDQTTESEFVYGGFGESCNVQAPGEGDSEEE